MFGLGKVSFKEGDYIFGTLSEGDYSSIVVGVVEFKQDNRLKIKGVNIKPIGLLEKRKSGKINARQLEVLKSPTSYNVIHILINKVDTNEIDDYIEISQFNNIEKLNLKRFSEIDFWLKEGLPELFAIILSGGEGTREAKEMLIKKMNNIHDVDIKKTVYSIARQLQIL
ncbi:MAG: hypothetical protein QW416_04270 [Candidatus Nitrosocaldaceae archaeon]